MFTRPTSLKQFVGIVNQLQHAPGFVNILELWIVSDEPSLSDWLSQELETALVNGQTGRTATFLGLTNVVQNTPDFQKVMEKFRSSIDRDTFEADSLLGSLPLWFLRLKADAQHSNGE